MALPVAVFQGYDSVLGVGMSTAVEGQVESVGGTSFVKCDICSTTTELMDSLEVGQSVAVGFAGLVSVSQKMQLVESLKLTTFSTSIVVFARHTQAKQAVTHVRLRDGVAAPADNDQLHDFVLAYGDSYLSGRTVGGEYYAVYTYYSASQAEQRELEVQMGAAGLFKGIGVDASLQHKISRLNTTQTHRISFQQRMSGIASPTFPSSDNITDFALQFPSMELTAPTIIQWTTSGYERIPEIGRIFTTVARNRELLAGRDASIALTKLRDLQEAIRALRQVYAFYGGYAGDTKLNNVEAEAEKDDATVRGLVTAYREDPTQPLSGPLDLPSLRNGSPSLQYKVQVFGEDKGHGHMAFDDVDLASHLPQYRRISSIQLRASHRLVNCIVVTYTDEQGSRTFTHGTHDNDPGSVLTRELLVRPGRSINVVSGHYGPVRGMAPAEVVTRLHVGLDNHESISGGVSAGVAFSWTAQPHGTFLLGFRGRAGWFIDVLQLVYASFNPAEWSVY